MAEFGYSTSIRLPICFCVDLTESMLGDGIEETKTILRSFQKAVSSAIDTGLCIETAVVSFLDTVIAVSVSFCP